MNQKLALILPVALLGGLLACSRNAPPVDNLPIGAGQQAGAESVPDKAAPPAETSLANADAILTVEPGFVTTCEGQDRTAAIVKWEVKRPSVVTVKLEVSSVADPQRKTFAMGGAVGEATTENWVIDGVQFHLSDTATGDELANYTVTSKPCAVPE